jgi:hypothetical protein
LPPLSTVHGPSCRAPFNDESRSGNCWLVAHHSKHIVCEGGACGAVSDTAVWAGQQTRDTLIGSGRRATIAARWPGRSGTPHTTSTLRQQEACKRGCVGVLGCTSGASQRHTQLLQSPSTLGTHRNARSLAWSNHIRDHRRTAIIGPESTFTQRAHGCVRVCGVSSAAASDLKYTSS